MTDGRKKWIWAALAVGIILLGAVAAGVVYWNSMLDLIGDAEETVPPLSREEEDKYFHAFLRVGD